MEFLDRDTYSEYPLADLSGYFPKKMEEPLSHAKYNSDSRWKLALLKSFSASHPVHFAGEILCTFNYTLLRIS